MRVLTYGLQAVVAGGAGDTGLYNIGYSILLAVALLVSRQLTYFVLVPVRQS